MGRFAHYASGVRERSDPSAPVFNLDFGYVHSVFVILSGNAGINEER